MMPLLIAGVLWIRPPHGIRRWLSLEATYTRQWSTHLRKNPLKIQGGAVFMSDGFVI